MCLRVFVPSGSGGPVAASPARSDGRQAGSGTRHVASATRRASALRYVLRTLTTRGESERDAAEAERHLRQMGRRQLRAELAPFIADSHATWMERTSAVFALALFGVDTMANLERLTAMRRWHRHRSLGPDESKALELLPELLVRVYARTGERHALRALLTMRADGILWESLCDALGAALVTHTEPLLREMAGAPQARERVREEVQFACLDSAARLRVAAALRRAVRSRAPAVRAEARRMLRLVRPPPVWAPRATGPTLLVADRSRA